jgi:hypothetical protein
MKTKLLLTLLVVLGCVISGFAQVQSKDVIIFSDDFGNGVISSRDWTYAGNSVTEEGSIMKVATTVTDKGGSLESRWIDVDPQGVLVISRRTKVNYGNEYFIGAFSITFESAPELKFGINYSNYTYDEQGYCPNHGFFLFRNNANVSECKAKNNVIRIEPVWNKWFDEKIIYNFGTGLLEYYIDGRKQSEFSVGKLQSSKRQRVKLSFNAWGWWTGHYQYFDNVAISQGAYPRNSSQQEKKPLTNDDIVTMIKAGLSESTIVLAIQQAPVNFDTSPDALIQLKNQGASSKILDALLQAQARKLETQTPSPVSPSPASPAPMNNVSETKVTVKDFTFELVSCKRSAGGVICELKATNDFSEDREIEISGAWYHGDMSKMFDEFGGEYIANNVTLGSDKVRGYMYLPKTLVSKIPMTMKITFDEINPEAKVITLLRIAFAWKNSRGGKISADLKNIPITR